MRIRRSLLAAALPLALAAPQAAGAATVAPGHVLVRFDGSATHAERVAAVRATGTGNAIPLPGGAREVRIEDGESVAETLGQLRAQPGVAEVRPDYVLRKAARGYYPNDPGVGDPGDWRSIQWNFAGRFGIHAPRAWARMRKLDRDGGRGVVVAVIDTGVAYEDRGSFKRAPDLYRGRFEKGWDFVEGDRFPFDEDGHGTHVSGTLAEHVNNKKAVTGLSYGIHIMPVRVLNAKGTGNGSTFARSIKWAADHGADVINLSVEFDPVLRAGDIPDVIAAMRYAHQHHVTMVGSSGNLSGNRVAYPARDKNVISVGATTEHGCQAEYSSYGDGLDLVAPGGGGDASLDDSAWERDHCDGGRDGRVIYQQTFLKNPRDFHLVGFAGTSEAAPHVTAAAALVIASGVVGSDPRPGTIQHRLEDTARDLGASGYDKRYGHGLLDAAAAVGG
ncbi:MAG TPA: S8 family serine peptidase [Thermoleophilaceae bacterium]|nr:S8 family serine peptidase [Thermoleophilaceae bacterium]